MPKKFRLQLAASNEKRLPSLWKNPPKLTLIKLQEDDMAQEQPKLDHHATPNTIRTLQTMLRAEARFLTVLRDMLINKGRSADEVRALNTDKVIHIARFFFLLETTQIKTPQAISVLVDEHNQRIRGKREDEMYHPEKSKLKKILFSEAEQVACMNNLRQGLKVAFTQIEIAKFLFEHMSVATTKNTVNYMVQTGLLLERVYPPDKGANRTIIYAEPSLIRAVEIYLRDIEIGILNG
ncbi:hypothetical protein [Sulfitobacter sp.]|uniref:hypothetical protein n=1 Tax=Sulfitobacter sp. TaxID=1903071 RepID=UPI003EF5ABAB